MQIASVCGRFDNAPAHLIIISPRFNTSNYATRPDREPRPTKEESEAKREEKYRLSKLKAEARKKREADERLQKMAIMRKKEAAARHAKIKDWRPGETRDQRRNRLTREKTQARYDAMIAALPSGYVPLQKIKLNVGFEYARRVLSEGPVHGVKIGRTWYTSAPVLKSYFVQRKARQLAGLKKGKKGGK